MNDPIKEARAQMRKAFILIGGLMFLAGVAHVLIKPLMFTLIIFAALFLLRGIARWLLSRR
ncbi:hypothetical protein ABZ345_45390 [Lentzea sp. NPDC005914]|uniref:hypothetical protein n=1 Tax=Lentzea sp. NPDC005914 TaxID=3154572 RepID=UPI0033D6D865